MLACSTRTGETTVVTGRARDGRRAVACTPRRQPSSTVGRQVLGRREAKTSAHGIAKAAHGRGHVVDGGAGKTGAEEHAIGRVGAALGREPAAFAEERVARNACLENVLLDLGERARAGCRVGFPVNLEPELGRSCGERVVLKGPRG